MINPAVRIVIVVKDLDEDEGGYHLILIVVVLN